MDSLLKTIVSIIYIISNSFNLIDGSCNSNLTESEIWFDGPWDYRDIGPHVWDVYCPHFCNSTYMTQSPIDIDTESATEKIISEYSNFFDFWQWTSHSSWLIENNGHSLHLVAADANNPVAILNSVQTDDNYTYNLFGIHFHWGNVTTEGSEHQINSIKYPLEVHFVHYRNDFPSIGDAIEDNSESNAGVVGILFELVSEEEENDYLNILIDNLTMISGYHDTRVLDDFDLYEIIKMDEDNTWNEFYYYEGSLTTPPCDPIVRWFVLKDTLKVSSRQLKQFRVLENYMGEPLEQNWRPPQDNINTVYHIKLTGTDSMDGSIKVRGSMIVCIISLMTIYFVW